MRRVNSSEPGAFVLCEAGTVNLGGGMRIETPVQISLDTDVRKLVDKLRRALVRRLRGSAKPPLAKQYSVTAVAGGPDLARCQIDITSGNADKYLDRVFDRKNGEVVPVVLAEWTAASAPASGDGVGTEQAPDLSGAKPFPLG